MYVFIWWLHHTLQYEYCKKYQQSFIVWLILLFGIVNTLAIIFGRIFLCTCATIFIEQGPRKYKYCITAIAYVHVWWISTKLSCKTLLLVSIAFYSHATLLSLQDESGTNRGLWTGCWQPNHPSFHVPWECQEPACQRQLCVGTLQGPGFAVDCQRPVHRTDPIVSLSAGWEWQDHLGKSLSGDLM